MKLSIIIPVFNNENQLERCLDSVIKQEIEGLEIIIVNDGSTDNSESIIKNYIKKSEKIVYLKQENLGQHEARNLGLKYAKGEYIGFIDADDYIENTMYKKMYKKAISEKLDIVLCNAYMVVNGKNKVINTNSEIKNFSNRYIISRPNVWLRIIKKEILDNVKFNKIYYEDLELMPSLVLYTNNIGFIEEPLYYYIKRKGALTAKKKVFKEELLDVFKAINNLEEVFKNKSMYEKYKEELEYLNIIHIIKNTGVKFSAYSKNRENFMVISKYILEKYPEYKKNQYYKHESITTKLIVFFVMNKQYLITKILFNIFNKCIKMY